MHENNLENVVLKLLSGYNDHEIGELMTASKTAYFVPKTVQD